MNKIWLVERLKGVEQAVARHVQLQANSRPTKTNFI